MKKIFCVRDNKSKCFPQPMFLAYAPGEALRGFQDVVNDDKSQLCKHPEDYTLYELGDYDMEKGVISSHAEPKVIAHASDVKNAKTAH